MRKLSITKEFEALLYQIRRDIFLIRKTVKDDNRIKVSIPHFYRAIFEHYHYEYMKENPNFTQIPVYETIYGIEIVNGYNNQICIFDEYAKPEDKFLEPILITL